MPQALVKHNQFIPIGSEALLEPKVKRRKRLFSPAKLHKNPFSSKYQTKILLLQLVF